METLKELSKKDKYWRGVAFGMSGSKELADTIVQEMYLRLHDKDLSKCNDGYVCITIWNLFKDIKKFAKYPLKINEETLGGVTITQNFSYNDKELLTLNKIKELSDKERMMLELNYDYSFGQIATMLDMCRIKVFRDLTKIRKKVLGDDFDKKYKNSRLKYKKII